MRGYTEKGKEITLEDVKKYFEEHKKYYKVSDYDNLSDFVNINNALLNDRDVFALCEKFPKTYDAGNHYYSVYYVTEKGNLNIFWVPAVMNEQNRDRYMRKYIFKSRAIGTSRVLDATDIIFTILKAMGGCYHQIDVL